ncbi:zinc ribbon domain-containing protein [Candidatus Woesearchaeota archaeon]|nr:zinc ribbon domain-containing protein [Candidatus Woesearchaeota archaeon]
MVINLIKNAVKEAGVKMETTISSSLGKIQKQIILNIKPTKEYKTGIFDSILNFMEFRDFSLTDSVRPTYAEFQRKRGITGIFMDKIKVRIKELENQAYILVGSNMASSDKKEQFEDEMDALKQFLKNKVNDGSLPQEQEIYANCKKCGIKLSKNSKFCGKCGTKK